MSIVMWWVACSNNVAVEGPAKSTADLSPTTLTTPAPNTDAALMSALISGQGDPSAVAQEIAWSDGWPIRDSVPAEGGSVWFMLRDDGPGPWSVSGDFSDWEPVAMTRAAGFFWAHIDGADMEGFRYKFVSGDTWIADPLARSYDYDDNGEISYVSPPNDAPRIDRWPALTGTGTAASLQPRDLAVYVPTGDGPWPVLYAHDGQNLFDPNAIWGGWRLQEALASRDPVLVVGIFNTSDRMDEYTHVPDDIGYGSLIGGKGDDYADLVEQSIRPHIESIYGSTGTDGQLGSSLGGLISLHIAQRYQGRYDFAASLSGTLGWGRFAEDNDTIEQRWLADPPSSTAVYVDSGGDPGPTGCTDPDNDGYFEDDPDASDNYCESRQFVDALAANGYTWDSDLWHWWEPGAEHNEAAWATRVAMPLDHFLTLP